MRQAPAILARFRAAAAALLIAAALSAPAAAHVSERALVLLLPTQVYITAGVAAVAATVLLLVLVPPAAVREVFAAVVLPGRRAPGLTRAVSWAAALVLLAALLAGLFGPHDPLSNPLPLLVWTAFWIALPPLQALVGNIWAFANPWSGPARLLPGPFLPRGLRGLGYWPAAALWLCFALFANVHPAPDDPHLLALVVGSYWLATLAACAAFGRRWLFRGEPLTLLLSFYARLSPLRCGRPAQLALPGARLTGRAGPGISGAFFIVAVLGAGSFDGLNETFAWLGLIGVNPLEFPGRSAVAGINAAGMIGFIACLAFAFAACVAAGLVLAGGAHLWREAAPRLALSLLPIAMGYHVAHFLTAFLVNGQYALLAVSDPFAAGADLLGLGEFYVTTGFFNTTATVRAIWLTQGGAIVIGHILAVLVAHAIATELFGDRRRAALSQLPLAAFMVFYTFFGLWLLASPTAV